jgi:hypothetical protein
VKGNSIPWVMQVERKRVGGLKLAVGIERGEGDISMP